MSDNTAIEWTNATWNPIVGCSVVSAGCTNCYAMKEAWRHGHNPKTPQYQGLTKKVNGNPVWTGKVNLVKHRLTEPLRWKKPRRIFVNSMSDLFHENVPDWWIFLILAVMAQTYDVTETNENDVVTKCAARHTYQVLTKRPRRMKSFMTDLHATAQAGVDEVLSHPFSEASRRLSRSLGHPYWMNAPLSSWLWVQEGCPGLWLGVSVEDRQTMLTRGAALKETPAAVRFWSAEPLLEHLGKIPRDIMPDQIIVGGESGPNARPMDARWVRSIIKQCNTAGVAVYVKQMGKRVIDRNDVGFEGCDKTEWHLDDPFDQVKHNIHGYLEEYQGADCLITLRDPKGGDPNEWPESMRVREFPENSNGTA